ncbi:DNA polymerase III subunit alpha [Hahella sp. KA22]|uniref:error-prone DNA polymerase n=1 Tax=Hahella sp. KA22 TaxID=1628392 RepID=UPI000FDF24EC|nr:error-prone DNA polymerase [Hahella sp. KA22]AZZ93428.1 DNA polymerase III subunit alpha [Hahella sp. KA22]QAY56803.1 DNA polymerase III subunit alpha [Hahella sp. KA22]
MSFAELHCISNYSFLKGASHPEELVQQAIEQGYSAVAITDECSVAGVVKAWRELRRLREETPDASAFKLIIGSEFQSEGNCFVVLAPHKKAYGELCRFITDCRRKAEKGDYQFSPHDLNESVKQGLLLWRPKQSDQEFIPALAQAFSGRLWLLLELSLSEEDSSKRELIQTLSDAYSLPVVCSNEVMMHTPERKPLHDALTAIRLNQSVDSIKERLAPNAENYLRPLSEIHEIYPTSAIQESLKIAAKCTFELNEIRYQYPTEVVPKGDDPSAYLRRLTYEGAHLRYPQGIPEAVLATLEKELKIISELQYEYYFLTIFDIVDYAKKSDILCQGRGSAANSVVCYCLGITAVDPTKASLLFERFISKGRDEPPDIDVDFENARREEVIQYLYRRYGRERCAIAATIITYRPKSAIRDLGKALGVDLLQLENVIANYGWRYRGQNWIDEVITPQVSQDNHILTCFKELLPELLGFPRHLSQHVGGFVLSAGPLVELVPIENAAMEERTVIQWDKDDLESLGLMKVDVLALGMLTALKKCTTYISEITGKTFSLESIPKDDDSQVYKMLQQADTVGLFQVESRAQMNMLPRLRPEKYYDLVVQVAIVRPGPIHGDMVHPYLRRRHNLEDPEDVPLSELKPILERTFGVPIFQEQVIAIAIVGAGFTSEEAEELRRSMASWKRRGHMGKLMDKLITNLLNKGVPQEYIQRLCRQIEGFGEYGFPESHAASFALLAYHSGWLKYYYPSAFCCALLNSQPMGFYAPWQLVQDAQRHGVIVLPVDINNSYREHRLEPHTNNTKEGALRLGFKLVKGLSEEAVASIIQHRTDEGFTSLAQVMHLPRVTREDLEALASANALTSLGDNRYQQRWECSGFLYYYQLFSEFEYRGVDFKPPDRLDSIYEDHASTGVVLGDHPLAYLREANLIPHRLTAAELLKQKAGLKTHVAGVVINRQRPKTSTGVTFLTLEDETGSINIIVWKRTAMAQMDALVKARLLMVYGEIDKDDEGRIAHVIAHRLIDLTSHLEGLESPSRDFH